VKLLAELSLVAFSIVGCATVNSQSPALVEYHRSGGIAGRDDRLVVNADGTARLYRRGAVTDFSVGADTLERLRATLREIKFESLRAEYLPPRGGADLFEYVVVYGNHRVRAIDTAVPSELQSLLQLLNGLLAKTG
jgi:hypothetical protein